MHSAASRVALAGRASCSFLYPCPRSTRLIRVLDVEVNQVVEDLDVAHLDASVLGQGLAYQIHILIHAHSDAFSCHQLTKASKNDNAIAIMIAQPTTLVPSLGLIPNFLVI